MDKQRGGIFLKPGERGEQAASTNGKTNGKFSEFDPVNWSGSTAAEGYLPAAERPSRNGEHSNGKGQLDIGDPATWPASWTTE